MDRDKIIEIAKYCELNELICRKCGSITPIEEVYIKENLYAYCPECGKGIRQLPSSKLTRIFYKGSTHQIPSFNDNELLWILGHMKLTARQRSEIQKEIVLRFNNNKTASKPTLEEDSQQKEKIDLSAKIATYQNKIKSLQKELLEKSNSATYFEIESLSKRLAWNKNELKMCIDKYKKDEPK